MHSIFIKDAGNSTVVFGGVSISYVVLNHWQNCFDFCRLCI